MRLQKKSLSKISLLDLLRKKKSSLENFLRETGIVTYELLVTRCDSIGVVPPAESQFLKAMGNPVMHNISSPTEGIIVLDAVEERQDNLAPDAVEDSDQSSDVQDSQPAKKKKKKKEQESSVPAEDPQS